MKSYEYKMSLYNALSALIVGLALIAFSVYAIVNGWGISISGGGIEPKIAKYFYLFFIALGAVVLFLSFMLKAIGSRVIQQDETSIRVPKSELSRKVITIQYKDIRDLVVQSYNNIQTLVVTHDGGTTKIRSPHFESLDAFYDFSDSVASTLKN